MFIPTWDKTGRRADWLVCCLATLLLLVVSGCRQGTVAPGDLLTSEESAGNEDTTNDVNVVLEILTRPPAVVSVDGQQVGMAPLQISVPQGLHSVRVELDGYETQVRQMTLSESIQLSFALPSRLPKKWSLPQGCTILSLSPDNAWIAFHCDLTWGEAAMPVGTWVGRVGEEDRAFLLSDDSNLPTADWSPNGAMLLLTYTRGPVLLFQNEDWESGRLLYQETLNFGKGAAWSPDSKRIAFATLEHGVALALLDTDGTVEVLLRDVDVKQPPGFNYGPAWSPDGSRLVYLTLSDWNEPFSSQLWTIDVASRKQEILFEANGQFLLEPVWSPDGRFIAFTGPQHGISFFDLEASELRGVPLPEGATIVTPTVYNYAWAPNSDRLAVQTTAGLWIVSASSGKVSHVTEKSGRIIRWTGDSREIVAYTWQDGKGTIELIPVN